MDYKKNNAPTSIITRDCGVLENKTGNLYETVVVASKRADQIGVDLKTELNKKLEEFASYTDNLEEIFENREQIEISKFYERLPKPTLLALQEILEDKINFRIPTEEEIAQAREIDAIRERDEEQNRQQTLSAEAQALEQMINSGVDFSDDDEEESIDDEVLDDMPIEFEDDIIDDEIEEEPVQKPVVKEPIVEEPKKPAKRGRKPKKRSE